MYRIGAILDKDATLVDSLLKAAVHPFQQMRKVLKGHGAGAFDEPVWALRHLTFNINEGDVVGIIGRNGAGKSTLLKVLSEITAPNEGRAVIRGRIASLLEVGTGFHRELTGRENVYLNGTILGMSSGEISRKFDEMVDFAGVEKFIDTPVKYYSSGMRLRLAFAVAAHLEPEIMVIDEVLAVGDAAFQKKCIGKMADVASQGRTILFVSHNMAAVGRLCNRGIVLEKGEMVFDGGMDDAISAYFRLNGDSAGVRTFEDNEAPGGDDLKLVRMSLLTADGHPTANADVSDELRLSFDYRVLTPGLRFRVQVMFQTQGVVAFSAVEPEEAVREHAGVYRSSVTIPAHLLSETEYTIGISVFSSMGAKQHYLRGNDLMIFQVTDSMQQASARGDYAQRLVGVVRPWLKWEPPKVIDSAVFSVSR